nr:hypothetical protein 2 [bacterium]
MTNSLILTGGRNYLRSDPFLQAGQLYGADLPVFDAAFDAYAQESPGREDQQKRQIRQSIEGETIHGSVREGITDRFIPPEQPLTRESWQDSDDYRQDIQWHDGMTPTQARILAKRRDARIRLQNVNQFSGGSLSGEISAMLAAELTDSYNIATSAAPVPGIGKLARIIERGGGIIARVGARGVRGAAEGAFGSALVEPFLAQGNELLQEDYSFADSLQNIAMGAFVGSALHTGVGFARGEFRRVPTENFKQSLDTALAQAQLGKEIDVRPILRTEPVEARQAERILQEFSDAAPGSQLEFRLGDITGKGADARYSDYTPLQRGDRYWLESIGDEISVGDGFGREWFDNYNRLARESEATKPVTQRKVKKVVDKLLNNEPLGKREGEIAESLVATSRFMRLQHAAKNVEMRQKRPIVRRQEALRDRAIDNLLNQTPPDSFNRRLAGVLKNYADQQPAGPTVIPLSEPVRPRRTAQESVPAARRSGVEPAQQAQELAQSAGEAAGDVADRSPNVSETVASFDVAAKRFDDIAAESEPVRELADIEKEVQGLEETIAEAQKLEHLDAGDETELKRIAELESEGAEFTDAIKAFSTCMRMG